MNWKWGERLPRPCSAFGCTALPGGILTVGGTYWTTSSTGEAEKRWTHDVYWFASDAQVWKQLVDFPVEISQVLLVPLEKRVYAIGGRNADQAFRETYWIEPTKPQGDWKRGPDLPAPLTALQGGVASNFIYAVTTGQCMEDLRADPKAGTSSLLALNTTNSDSGWAEVAKVPESTIGYRTAAIAAGKLLLFGGASLLPDGSLELCNNVSAFDLKLRTWNVCQSLPFPLRDATALTLDNRFALIAGGVEDAANGEPASDGKPRIIVSNRVLIYDTFTDRFSYAEPLRLGVADHGLVTVDSKVYAVGGEDSPYRTRTDLVQICDKQKLLSHLLQPAKTPKQDNQRHFKTIAGNL